MNSITDLTRRDIYEAFRDGVRETFFDEIRIIEYPYYGRLDEIDFLKRIYDLKKMPPKYSSYKNAEEDIIKHAVVNDDYPYCWVFEDERFELSSGSDEKLLKFLCEVFDPRVRDEKLSWKQFYDHINSLLIHDGYELYVTGKISNHDVFGWRIIPTEVEGLFIPYSQRNRKRLTKHQISISIPQNLRRQISKVLESTDDYYDELSNDGLTIIKIISEEVFSELNLFYEPKYYKEKGKYVNAKTIYDVVSAGLPQSVLDIIELFCQSLGTDQKREFESKINQLFILNETVFRIHNGKFEDIVENQFLVNSNLTPEKGLKKLIEDASSYFDQGEVEVAIEKIWDAFERLKTFYSPILDKKRSANKIINDLSSGNDKMEELFAQEFKELTVIGNSFRIRHHEMDKNEITDPRQLDYLYKRCMSLVSVAIKVLNEQCKKI